MGPSTSRRDPTARCGRPRMVAASSTSTAQGRRSRYPAGSAGSRSARIGGSTSSGRRASIASSSDLSAGPGTIGGVALPTGTVTFLFSDIEGSTRLARSMPADAWAALAQAHDDLADAAVAAHDGVVVKHEGDGMFAAFGSAIDAMSAAVALSRAMLLSEATSRGDPGDTHVRLRIGIHTGIGQLTRDGSDYVGVDVHYAARVAGAGNGGQIVVSDATRAVLTGEPPPGTTLVPAGSRRLKDFDEPKPLHRLVVPDAADDERPLRAAGNVELPTMLTSFVGREAEVATVADLLGRSRIVSLDGPGGTGKTRLSVGVAEAVAARFPDGAVFVELAPIRDPALVAYCDRRGGRGRGGARRPHRGCTPAIPRRQGDAARPRQPRATAAGRRIDRGRARPRGGRPAGPHLDARATARQRRAGVPGAAARRVGGRGAVPRPGPPRPARLRRDRRRGGRRRRDRPPARRPATRDRACRGACPGLPADPNPRAARPLARPPHHRRSRPPGTPADAPRRDRLELRPPATGRADALPSTSSPRRRLDDGVGRRDRRCRSDPWHGDLRRPDLARRQEPPADRADRARRPAVRPPCVRP